jgi:hypothetical protein
MDASITTPVIAGIAGIVVASSVAVVKGAIASRGKENEELRTWRLKVYPPVWKLTSTVPRWPQADPTYGDLWRLHLDLRNWYYNSGGLYLSENARARYGEMQELLDAYLDGRDRADETAVSHLPSGATAKDSPYKALMDTCSAFRTALTEDLSTRRTKSVLWAIVFWWRHRKQRREAKQRLQSALQRSVATGARVATLISGVADAGVRQPVNDGRR